jgi:hypothetical protein
LSYGCTNFGHEIVYTPTAGENCPPPPADRADERGSFCEPHARRDPHLGPGRLTEALGWAQLRELSVDDALSYLREFEHITLARVLIACYKSDRVERFMDEAVRLLERLLKAAEEGGRIVLLVAHRDRCERCPMGKASQRSKGTR